MDYSTPGFPVFHYLLELAQSHVNGVSVQLFTRWASGGASLPKRVCPPGSALLVWLGSSGDVGG